MRVASEDILMKDYYKPLRKNKFTTPQLLKQDEKLRPIRELGILRSAPHEKRTFVI